MKTLKTDVHSMDFIKNREAEEDFSTASALAFRKHVTHAPAQLRLARTHERIEIEIDFPVRGGCHKGELTPPNLRYIYIYIY